MKHCPPPRIRGPFPRAARGREIQARPLGRAEWGVTNKQGMTFGILLAAALLTVVPLLPVRGAGSSPDRCRACCSAHRWASA